MGDRAYDGRLGFSLFRAKEKTDITTAGWQFLSYSWQADTFWHGLCMIRVSRRLRKEASTQRQNKIASQQTDKIALEKQTKSRHKVTTK